MADSSTHSRDSAPPRDHDAAMLRHMFASAGIAMIAAGRDLKIQFWNPAAMRLFGASAERMIGTDVTAIVPEPRRRLARQILRRAIEGAESNEFEFQHRDEKGRSRELAVAVTPVADPHGRPLGALVCARDITRRVEAIARLHHSEKMASLGQMAGEMAHHFNNILGGVVTSVDFALAGDDDAHCRRVLEQTARAVGRATHLVRGLLAFAEGDAVAGDLSDLTEIILDIADAAERSCRDHHVEFKLVMQQLPVTPVPRNQMSTVLRNLVQNALDVMPDGGKLTIEAAAQDERVLISVIDTGTGLEPDEARRIFEPFFRAKGDRKLRPPSEARGLGLAVVFGILQRWGASISVSSKPGEGTRFDVSIPTGSFAHP